MNQKIGEIIKKYRASVQKSQEELASDLKVSANYISLIENNKRFPSKTFIRKFSQKYNIPSILFTLPTMIPLGENKEEKEIEKKLFSIMNQLEEITLSRIRNEKTR